MAKLIQFVTLFVVLFAVMEFSECRGRRGGNGFREPFPRQNGGRGFRGKPHFFIRGCQNETEATTESSNSGGFRPRGELKCTSCIDNLAQLCTFQRSSTSGTTEVPDLSDEDDVNAPNIDE